MVLEANGRPDWGAKGFEKQDVGVLRSQKDVCKELAERGGGGAAVGEKLARGVSVQRRIGVAAGK